MEGHDLLSVRVQVLFRWLVHVGTFVVSDCALCVHGRTPAALQCAAPDTADGSEHNCCGLLDCCVVGCSLCCDPLSGARLVCSCARRVVITGHSGATRIYLPLSVGLFAAALHAVIFAHIFHLPHLACCWSLAYCAIVSSSLLAHAHRDHKNRAALLLLAGLAVAVLCHVNGIAGPTALPLRNAEAVLGLNIADVAFMVAHFCIFFAVGFACACGAATLCASPLLQSFMTRGSGLCVLCVLPLAAVTLPKDSGYVILVGNFPTYTGSMHRFIYHFGGWVWVGLLVLMAHHLLAQPVHDAVRLFVCHRVSATLRLCGWCFCCHLP